MLKLTFLSEQEITQYITLQTERMNKGYLSASERKQLELLIKNPKQYVKEKNIDIKPIITDINRLQHSCISVTKEDNILSIIKELKTTLLSTNGMGLSANQIGYNKAISYIRFIKGFNRKLKKHDIVERILINPKIIDKNKKIIVKNEMCLSIPNVKVTTDRYSFILLQNQNEALETVTFPITGYEAIVIQHEIDHLNGKIIFDRKHKTRR